MDEIEMVSSLRTDPAPTPDTVAHHKSQLQAAMAAAGNGRAAHRVTPTSEIAVTAETDEAVVDLTLGRTSEPAHRRRSRRGRILAAAAAVAVTGGVAAVLAADDGPDVRASAPSPAGGACGSDLPFTFAAPAGFDDPVDGPFPGDVFGMATPLDGQVLRHWTSPTGSIELRWPSQDLFGDHALVDAPVVDDATTTLPPPPVDDAAASSVLVTAELPEGADVGASSIDVVGEGENEMVSDPVGYSGQLSSPQLGEGECGTVRLIVTAHSDEAARALFAESHASLLAAIDLIGTESAEPTELADLPTTEAPLPDLLVREDCTPPIDGSFDGVEDLSSFPTHEETSAAFEQVEADIAAGAYDRDLEPDGSVAFAFPDRDERAALIVYAELVDGRWNATGGELTAC